MSCTRGMCRPKCQDNLHKVHQIHVSNSHIAVPSASTPMAQLQRGVGSAGSASGVTCAHPASDGRVRRKKGRDSWTCDRHGAGAAIRSTMCYMVSTPLSERVAASDPMLHIALSEAATCVHRHASSCGGAAAVSGHTVSCSVTPCHPCVTQVTLTPRLLSPQRPRV